MASRSRHYKTPVPDARVAFYLTGIGCYSNSFTGLIPW